MKRLNKSVLAALVFGMLSGQAGADQKTVGQLSEFGVKYQVLDNHAALNGVDCAALGADWASCNKAVITLTNHSHQAVTSHDWAIYFPSIRQILRTDNPAFTITHVTGDLHKLEPTEKFTGFAAGQSVDIPIVNEYWQLFMTDVIPRWYVTAPGAQPQVIASTDTEDLTQFVAPIGDNWKRTPDDNNILMTADTRFEKNSDVSRLAAQSLRGAIIPTPKQIKVHKKDAVLSNGVALDLAVLLRPSAEVIEARFKQLGIKTGSGYPVRTSIAPKTFTGDDARSGAYRLTIKEGEAVVTGFDQTGVFYGLQSILSLVPVSGAKTIATLDASDAPRFDYRGMFIDVGRNFHSKAAILRALDQMAAYKLNKFHFHLSDDEGWRIEIPGLPELTEVGGKRCHDLTERQCLLPQLGSGPDSNNNGSGYFTRADYIEILKYAKARHIEVIPEIDMPAHARAAVVSMEARYDRLMKEGKPDAANEYRLLDPTDISRTTTVQFYDKASYLNPCLDSSRRFVDKVMSEILQMHKEAGLPLATWHFGADEAKNIYLGAGYTDKASPEAGKGQVDMSQQDKPWAKSEVCQALVASGAVEDMAHLPSWFAVEVSKLVDAHGIEKMQAWQDGLRDASGASAFATKRTGINFWDTLYWGGSDAVSDWANKGYEVTISNPDYVYFDFPYEVDPMEPGYYWGTRFTDERKVFSFAPDNLPQNAETSVDRDGNAFSSGSAKLWPGAHGLSAQVWSEVVRTDEEMEYRLFPRIISVAERAWHKASWEQDWQPGREYKGGETHYVDTAALAKDWQRFANVLGQRELAKLDAAGIAWRVPVPGARIVDGKLATNVSLPGLRVEYSVDGGEQWQVWRDDARPVVSGNVQVRAVSPDGNRTSRVVIVE